jgi:hypothetical protein
MVIPIPAMASAAASIQDRLGLDRRQRDGHDLRRQDEIGLDRALDLLFLQVRAVLAREFLRRRLRHVVVFR